jgi:hypothetical protein
MEDRIIDEQKAYEIGIQAYTYLYSLVTIIHTSKRWNRLMGASNRV